MIVHSRIAFIVILTLIQSTVVVTNGISNEKDPDINIHHTQNKLKFAKLLKSIVKANEDRFNAMKKLTHLQGVSIDRGVLRSVDNRFNKLEPILSNDSNQVLATVIVKHDESSEESSNDYYNDIFDEAPVANNLINEYFNLENVEVYPNYSEEDHFNLGREHEVLKTEDDAGKESFRLCSKVCAAVFRSVCRESLQGPNKEPM